MDVIEERPAALYVHNASVNLAASGHVNATNIFAEILNFNGGNIGGNASIGISANSISSDLNPVNGFFEISIDNFSGTIGSGPNGGNSAQKQL